MSSSPATKSKSELELKSQETDDRPTPRPTLFRNFRATCSTFGGILEAVLAFWSYCDLPWPARHRRAIFPESGRSIWALFISIVSRLLAAIGREHLRQRTEGSGHAGVALLIHQPSAN
jgi:hypothetical protein